MKTARIYLDTNIYCRPLDCQEDTRIRSETQATLKIIESRDSGKTVIISSAYVKFEIERIPEDSKRKDVHSFEDILSKVNISSSAQLISLANELLAQCGLGALDALHVAAACIGKADFLLTCDDEITGAVLCIEKLAIEEGYKLKVRNPIDYIIECGE